VPMTLVGDERTLMESLWRHMARDYARPLAGEDVLRITGFDEATLARAVRELASRPHPYVAALFHPQDPDRLVELRLTVDGQMYCRARD
jgi:hypothetical protein